MNLEAAASKFIVMDFYYFVKHNFQRRLQRLNNAAFTVNETMIALHITIYFMYFGYKSFHSACYQSSSVCKTFWMLQPNTYYHTGILQPHTVSSFTSKLSLQFHIYFSSIITLYKLPHWVFLSFTVLDAATSFY